MNSPAAQPRARRRQQGLTHRAGQQTRWSTGRLLPNEGAVCDDGAFCNGTEHCVDRTCTQGSPPCEPDAVPCTQTCDEAAQRCNAPVVGTCVIDGICYAGGADHPGAPCERCRPDVADDAWSPSEAPACAGDGCIVGDVVYDRGAINPDNPCEVCRPEEERRAWSPDDGAACDDGQFCNGAELCVGRRCRWGASPCTADALACTATCDEATDACNVPGPGWCVMNDTCHADGDRHPSDRCSACRSDVAADAWTATPCPAEVCDIEGIVYALGTTNPANPCESCQPRLAAGEWSADPDATCDDGEFCNGSERCLDGRCVWDRPPCVPDALDCTDTCDEARDTCNAPRTGHCTIAGACYAAGESASGDPCSVCDPERALTDWTPTECDEPAPPPDAGPPPDAESAPDSEPTDTGPTPDASTPPGATVPAPSLPATGGCDCRAAPDRAPAPWWMIALALSLAFRRPTVRLRSADAARRDLII